METSDTTFDNIPPAKPSFDIQKEHAEIDKLISEWNGERGESNKVVNRRKLREHKINVEEKQAAGEILPDETWIPDRTINTAIKRGRTPYVNYITQSRKLLILKDIDNPELNTESLERWFTDGMRYPGWKLPWIKQIDATHTHGGVAMELVYDTSKPFNCAIEYIPRNSLLVSDKCKDIQCQAILPRLYELTLLQLKQYSVKYNFDAGVVDSIAKKYSASDTSYIVKVYRVLMNRDDIIYNAWYCPDYNTKWLREPLEHDIGLFDYDPAMIREMSMLPDWASKAVELIQMGIVTPKKLKQYPIFWFPYDVTEDEEILKISGRTALDVHVQEALTFVMSSTVNGALRASKFYPCSEGLPGDDAKLAELGVLKPGVVWNKKISAQQFPWPSNILLAITQVLDQRKAQETGNLDFASVARKDANKTATEMQLATDQSNQLSITDIDVFSTPFLSIYVLGFLVATHQAIFGLCKPPPGETYNLLFRNYNMFPAGDVEVLKRAEEKASAKEFFEVVRGTPLAEKMLGFMLERFFPDHAKTWIDILAQPDKDEMIRQLLTILQNIPTDELTPEQQSAFRAVIISAQNMVGGTGDGTPNPQSGENESAVS